MNAKIIDLTKWREEHPPLVRLANVSVHLMNASFQLQQSDLVTRTGFRHLRTRHRLTTDATQQ